MHEEEHKEAAGADHDVARANPLTSYQWSAVKVDRSTIFIKRLAVFLVCTLFCLAVVFQIWDNIYFTGVVNTVKSQQSQDHTSSNQELARLDCEITGWNTLWSAVLADQAAAAAHQPNPKFVAPKKC